MIKNIYDFCFFLFNFKKVPFKKSSVTKQRWNNIYFIKQFFWNERLFKYSKVKLNKPFDKISLIKHEENPCHENLRIFQILHGEVSKKTNCLEKALCEAKISCSSWSLWI